MLNPKNFALTPAASDLGLGDSLKQQLDDNEEERKKKLLQQAQAMQSQTGMSPAASMLGIGNA